MAYRLAAFIFCALIIMGIDYACGQQCTDNSGCFGADICHSDGTTGCVGKTTIA